MTDKKYTYEEIIKGLTELSLYTGFQEKHIQVLNAAIDLITHQQAELENLKVENQSLRGAANSLKMHYEEAQAEIERLQKEVNLVSIQFQDLQERTYEIKAKAYKEFVEKLKNKWFDEHYDSPDVDFDDFIDNLLKEMVGEIK